MAAERYSVCVDISAKIENWEKPSVIAVSNGHSRALVVSAEVKQAAARLLSGSEPPQYTLMALLSYIVIAPDIERLSSVILDQDYSGDVAERIIRRLLLELLRRHRPKLKASAVRMQKVAGSGADRLARAIYKCKQQANGEITLEDIQGVLWA
jgi:hypothetical protein